MSRQGTAIVVSAPSGAGKSTLCNMLLNEFANLHFSISCTTRVRRPREKDGVDYYFISRGEFEKRREAGDFAEWAEVHGNLYGTPLKMAMDKLAAGADLLLDVDVQGAAQIKLTLPAACFVFIAPPSMEELKRRLIERGQDDAENIQRRLNNARDEIREALWYDALILNDDLQSAYAALRAVYMATTLAPGKNIQLLNRLLEEKIGR